MFSRLRIAISAALVCFVAIACLVGGPTAANAASGAGWRWPVAGEVITPFKNGSDPYAAGQHRGLDIAAAIGTPVGAATGGKVTFAGKLPDSGIAVTVRSADGRYLVSYLHLSKLSVARNTTLATGAQVGEVGITGKRSAAQPHLHFGVRSAASGEYVDPLPLLAPRSVPQPPATQNSAQAAPVASAPPIAKAQPRDAPSRPHRGHDLKTRSHDVRGRTRLKADRTPSTVRAPGAGDWVPASSIDAAGDSARESRAPRGRVAPPPLPVKQPDESRLSTPGRELRAAAPAASQQPATGSSSRSPYRLTLLLIAAGSLIALLIRRKPHAISDPPQSDAPAVDAEPAIGSYAKAPIRLAR